MGQLAGSWQRGEIDKVGGKLMRMLLKELAGELARELVRDKARELMRELIGSCLRAKQRHYGKAWLFKRLTKGLAKRQAMPQIYGRYCRKNSLGESGPFVALVLLMTQCKIRVNLGFREFCKGEITVLHRDEKIKN